MKIFEKIEDLLNNILMKLGGLIVMVLKKISPQWVHRLVAKIAAFINRVKDIPAQMKEQALKLKSAPKELLALNYKGIFSQAIEAGKKAYAQQQQQTPFKALLSALVSPFTFLYDWSKSLSPIHFFVLSSFTAGSLLSFVGIGMNAHHIFAKLNGPSRAPASVEVDPYNRPVYHRKETREVSLTNVKIPVYVEDVAALKSLLIDFSINTSNRATRQWLERHEFELRDHLVLTVEPVLPTFPMTDEGRSILSSKLKHEVNIFLEKNHIEGYANEVHLIYILAN